MAFSTTLSAQKKVVQTHQLGNNTLQNEYCQWQTARYDRWVMKFLCCIHRNLELFGLTIYDFLRRTKMNLVKARYGIPYHAISILHVAQLVSWNFWQQKKNIQRQLKQISNQHLQFAGNAEFKAVYLTGARYIVFAFIRKGVPRDYPPQYQTSADELCRISITRKKKVENIFTC